MAVKLVKKAFGGELIFFVFINKYKMQCTLGFR